MPAGTCGAGKTNDLRIIGTYKGSRSGPMLIALSGMHGNEPAGVAAVETLFDMLEKEPGINPGFQFKGTLIGLRGNIKALHKGFRQIVKDLNRTLTPENVNRVLKSPEVDLDAEDHELKDLYLTIVSLIRQHQPSKVVFIDLHTTSATGGIFSIVSDHPESVRIAAALHAPVIKGFLNGLHGTTLHFFNRENLGVETVGVSFEAGQHHDPLSVGRSIAAIVNCLRAIGCVRNKDVESRHDDILMAYSRGLPKITELFHTHRIHAHDGFQMMPGYVNFQPVRAGEHLATDCNGPILAPEDSFILMPLYQKQGSDGFFLVREVEDNA